MEINEIKIKRLKTCADVETLNEGDTVIISIGSGKINDFNEYHGPAVFIRESLERSQFHEFDFCRPQANLENWLVGYHIPKKNISITETGTISSREFSTYGYKSPKLMKTSNLY